MTIETARNPAYFLRLSCMAASLSQDPDVTALATTDYYGQGTYAKQDLGAEETAMLRDLERMAHQCCPQRNVTHAQVRAALLQYAQVTGLMAANLMTSPTTALPFASILAA